MGQENFWGPLPAGPPVEPPLYVKQDGCREFANEDDAPPSTPVETKAKRNYQKFKQKIWVRTIFQDHHSKGKLHLLVTFPRQVP